MPLEFVPEDELCLLLARGKLSAGDRARALEILAGPLLWDQVLRRAYEHQVHLLAFRSLRAIEFRHVPQSVRDELTAAFRTNALRNEFLSRKLAVLLATLDKAQIPVIPLKGVTLSLDLYGDPAFRTCSDIDILVPADKVLEARRVILAQGYTSLFSEDYFLNHQFRTGIDCSLYPGEPTPIFPYLVEVHWTVLHHSDKDRQAVADLWASAARKATLGIRTWALSPEWQFLFLAQHAANHHWQLLRWVADIHDLCVSASIDWKKVKPIAEEFDLDVAAAPTLAICAKLLGTPIPDEFSSAALPPGVELFSNFMAFSEAWSATLAHHRLLKRPSEKLRWLSQTVFVARPADGRIFRLPAALSFLYYVLRPLRLMLKWSWLGSRAGFTWLVEKLKERKPKVENLHR